ncbi:lineage-specific thermal regulator protein [Mariniblastus fucicola]|uniref:Lineage-specific thermal regulator protein n=2 Tax=Mariniblastus fucicola TaxID=980251 RepID=A0A5B9PHW4_9BACT|nr:lineage-specific thermal regulator protein [Mariniblastus fucicola]
MGNTSEMAKKVDKFESDLLRGSLDLMVLAVLDQGDQYGYLIQKQIREASGEKVSMSAGTMYPLLHRLEGEKLIRSRWDESTGRRRKWYSLTAAGRKRLTKQANQWNQYVQCMAELMQGYIQPLPNPG